MNWNLDIHLGGLFMMNQYYVQRGIFNQQDWMDEGIH